MVEKILTESVFIIHAINGYEYHEDRINKIFKELGLNFEFVTDGDPKLFTPEILEKYFVPKIKNSLSDGTLSCTLNHIYAYEKIVERKIKYALVFENDPFFLGDFISNLKKLSPHIENLKENFIISLENNTFKFPSFWETKKDKLLYPAKAGRMAGAYIINLEGASAIINDLKQNKCHTVIDWWHNSLIDRGIVKMYWAHPPLVEQGAHNGHLNSTISSSITRKISWIFQKVYKNYFRRIFREKHILNTNKGNEN